MQPFDIGLVVGMEKTAASPRRGLGFAGFMLKNRAGLESGIHSPVRNMELALSNPTVAKELLHKKIKAGKKLLTMSKWSPAQRKHFAQRIQERKAAVKTLSKYE